ncbi:uncharacterized protein PFL1_04084 [Pseudozyma flocculosa PF-1]|uniref:Methyltransferase domain-containing protein n=2 Tax=Pseudozyma flocculosa TaxID=84751 RepID=A0A5C3EV88_9BASI|nr:uncharacterized protein PFL1_04084 [Pseudozyma flocculosa PF-1]EPQ28257.1 hypothetical protein PFL1_04084 [Pseudozyma flocculosa PF-1]SPO35397.1 uncharacterized protein PSFLO_00868 [Pseudozyma flocculosa]
MTPLPDAAMVASHHLQAGRNAYQSNSVQAIQTQHRLDIIESWLRLGRKAHRESSDDPEAGIKGDGWERLQGRVMDLGCGQGDQTGALAAVMASRPELESSTVVGVDPGLPSYGSPFTLEQAQTHLARSDLFGDRLEFRLQQDGPSAMAEQRYATVVMAHSIWYLSAVSELRAVFRTARETGVQHLLLAEWALAISDPASLPHLLAALVQAQAPLPGGNIQNVLSPQDIKALAEQEGWKVEAEETWLPDRALQDGSWEIHQAFEAADLVETHALAQHHPSSSDAGNVLDPSVDRLAHAVRAARHALRQASDTWGKEARSMDVWTAVLVPDTDHQR